MKKVGVLIVLLLIVFTLAPLTLAADNETEEKSEIEKAFDCLEEKVDDCSKITTQEIALTIMATPDNVFNDCVEELENREKSNNWNGNVRDTALAALALKHAGKDTSAIEEWLFQQEQIPRELDWFMQLDANEAMKCTISYDSESYESIEIGENKKIQTAAGSCLSLARQGFWFRVGDNCYEKEFSIKCDKNFISSLLYENGESIPRTTYVLEGTKSAPAYEEITLDVRSKCFGKSGCDYEGTVWAALALKKSGHDIDDFIPYIVAMTDTNKKYLPDAFVYMLTNYEDYATKLVANQKLGDFWEADLSLYKKYYDTSLALLALGSSSSERVNAAEGWMLFTQGSNGCWQNSVRDTAIALWAIEGRPGKAPSSEGGNSHTLCSEANYFCIPNSECPANEVMGNFYCSSLSTTCCATENLKTCSEYIGQACLGDTFCVGNERRSSDVDKCCTGTCEERPQESECEANFYTCADFCSETQENAYLDCDGGQVCCRNKVAAKEKKSLWWIWLILFILLAVLGALAYVYREQLKEKLEEIKKKMGKGKSGAPTGGPKGPPRRPGMPQRPGMPPRRPGMPPRPGSPPVTRPQIPGRRPMPGYREDPAMRETFRKLRKIAAR
ncbi:hypothetical protein KAS08_01590 [Candidatus Pacearchaeota archaeon]|nr:hypothetical protein [Candidatus Pacearchaeota archaeon]